MNYIVPKEGVVLTAPAKGHANMASAPAASASLVLDHFSMAYILAMHHPGASFWQEITSQRNAALLSKSYVAEWWTCSEPTYHRYQDTIDDINQRHTVDAGRRNTEDRRWICKGWWPPRTGHPGLKTQTTGQLPCYHCFCVTAAREKLSAKAERTIIFAPSECPPDEKASSEA